MDDFKVLDEALPSDSAAAVASGAVVNPSTTVATTSTTRPKNGKCTTALMDYIGTHDQPFVNLCNLRDIGWSDENAEKHFLRKRYIADHPTDKDKVMFFKMSCKIGVELNHRTGCMNVYDQPSRKAKPPLAFPQILDLCMAPGGFSHTALAANENATVCAVTLDPKMGGHDVMLRHGDFTGELHLEFMDVTMLAGEMGVTEYEIPLEHPEARKLNYSRIFEDVDEFDLVFCGGTPTRNHRQHRAPYRDYVEGLRLAVSQLVIALNHIREGGTIVMLMHRAETWTTCQLMYMLSKFSNIRPFKPRCAHRTKSSFYLVATDVKPDSAEAKDAVRRWKAIWKRFTLYPEGLHDITVAELEDTDIAGEPVEVVLRKFGAQYVNKSRTIWLEQGEALKNAPWMKKEQVAGDTEAEGSGGPAKV